MINLENLLSDNNAMSYEVLIRRAHQCSRYKVPEADADLYRSLQRKAMSYEQSKNSIIPKTQNHFAEYMQSCGQISAYIDTAIEKVLIEYYSRLNTSQKNELTSIQDLLSTTPHLKEITEAIARAEKVFLDLELYPQ